jgi:hypothetical protein
LKRPNNCSTTSAPARAVPSPGDRARPAPRAARRRPPRQRKIPSSEPTYAAYKRPAPLLVAPHPGRELPVAPNRTATPPFAPPPPISTAGRPLPRRHLLKPSLTKVSTRIASPRPPPPLPPVPGRRRPLDAAARRRTEAPLRPSPVLDRGRKKGTFSQSPLAFFLFLSPFLTPFTFSPYYSKIVPRLIVNCKLPTVKP